MSLEISEHKSMLTEVAEIENIDIEELSSDFQFGHTVYLKNSKRNIKPLGIGRGLPTRINVNLGTSGDLASLDLELEKLSLSEDLGADTVMDLSTGGNITEIRRTILSRTRLPLGTVPIYECELHARRKYDHISRMSASEMLDLVVRQAEDGVDFMTIHAGVSLETVRKMKERGPCGRVLGIVSRGGSLLASWMLENNAENPFLEHYDELCSVLREYNVVISLGDGLRPGSIFDATDKPQISELVLLGELKERANDNGVQVIIEGPGHVPLSEIAMNIELEKKLCSGAPFYVLGPLPMDIAPGYDHITSAIGGAIAAAAGADFLCYVTPAEHLRLPDLDDVKQGIMASKIAAGIGDLEKGIKSAWDRNLQMGRARKNFDWKAQKEAALDPEIVERYRKSIALSDEDTCSMCGKLCAIKTTRDAFEPESDKDLNR